MMASQYCVVVISIAMARHADRTHLLSPRVLRGVDESETEHPIEHWSSAQSATGGGRVDEILTTLDPALRGHLTMRMRHHQTRIGWESLELPQTSECDGWLGWAVSAYGQVGLAPLVIDESLTTSRVRALRSLHHLVR